MSSFQTLYNTTVSTGRDKQWSIRVEHNPDGTSSIITEHGIVGGTQVVHNRVVREGKNVGRKNETTVAQQAMMEAQSDYNKKIRQGYSPSLTATATTTTATATAASLSKCVKPMLAQEFHPDKSSSVSYPVCVQPKLDGVRCLIYYSNGQLVFQSRQNTLYEPIVHMVPCLELLFSRFEDKNVIFDGELYIHKCGFNAITSIVRKSKTTHENVHLLQYHVYDYISEEDEPYSVRKDKLAAAFAFAKEEKEPPIPIPIRYVYTDIANNLQDIIRFQQQFIEDGYEGVMIRNMNGRYKQQSRSKDLQKYKTFKDGEFVVTGFHEGNGAHSGTPVFECVTQDNKPFSVTFADTVERKRQMMNNVQQYIGQQLTVKYQELSPDGIPRFPVGIAFRNYE